MMMFKLYLLSYADDTIILAESPYELQKALDAMSEYCSNWNLKVNTDKTKVVIFSKGKTRNKPDFIYEGAKLDIVDEFIYLGVKINYNGTYKKEQNYALQQGNRSMFSLISKCRAQNLDIDLQIELFDSLVQPVMLYGSEVWGA